MIKDIIFTLSNNKQTQSILTFNKNSFMKVVVKSTGEQKTAIYAANSTGNMRMNVDGKFYTDKQFGKMFTPIDENMTFRIHTDLFLRELVDNGLQPNMGVFHKPINIFRNLLAQVGEQAARINDHELNKLMIRLGIYSMACPDSEDYNADLVRRILANDLSVYS